MVAFSRTLLFALRASAPTDVPDGDQRLRDVEALLSGRPVMDGPLILPPITVETDPSDEYNSSTSDDLEVDEEIFKEGEFVEENFVAQFDQEEHQLDDELTVEEQESSVDNQTLSTVVSFNSTTITNLTTNTSFIERLQHRRAAVFGLIRQRSVAFKGQIQQQYSSLANATSAKFQALTSRNDNSTLNDTTAFHNTLKKVPKPTKKSRSKPKSKSSFSLYDWTEAFRCCARLAHGKTYESTKDMTFRNLTMILTPSLHVKPPPYTLSNFGGGEARYETIARITDLQADFDKGELVMLMPPPPSVKSQPALLTDIPNRTSDDPNESLPAPESSEKVITTADWLIQPTQVDQEFSESSDAGEMVDSMSMARTLKAYLIQLLIDEEDDKESDFQDKVDYAISLSARVDLDSSESLDESESEANVSTTTEKSARLRAYAPSYFAKLRQAYGIDESSYWKSLLDHESPFVSFQSNSKGAERVGGIFFFTRDGAYMIKTIKPDEVGSFLGEMLPKYGAYMQTHGRESLLCRFCGLYQVKLYASVNGTETVERSKAQTFAVMNACFPAQASRSINERFDLKGSTLGRETSQSEIQRKGSSAILKDLDLAKEVNFVRSSQHFSGGSRRGTQPTASNFMMQKEGLHIGPSAKAQLMSQLRKDVELLRECNAIDYSLLVGIAPRQSPMFNYLKSLVSATRGTVKFLFPKMPTLSMTNTRLMFGPSSYWMTEKYGASNAKLDAAGTFLYVDDLERCGVDAGPLSRLQGERLGVPAVYYLGVIDFLQPYNMKKSAEYRYKGMKYGMKAGYSCIPSEKYALRFLAFLDRHVT